MHGAHVSMRERDDVLFICYNDVGILLNRKHISHVIVEFRTFGLL